MTTMKTLLITTALLATASQAMAESGYAVSVIGTGNNLDIEQVVHTRGKDFDYHIRSTVDGNRNLMKVKTKSYESSRIDQLGDDNRTLIDVERVAGVASIQKGNWNSSRIYGSGDGNLLAVAQTGNANSAYIKVDGLMNDAIISQTNDANDVGGHAAIIMQGDRNYAWIQQQDQKLAYGTISVVGSDNHAVLNQHR